MVDETPARGMACPVCSIDLVMSERQGIEIDYCPKCRGVWLDRGELDKIIERSLVEDTRPVQGTAASSPAVLYEPRLGHDYGHGHGHGRDHHGGHGRRHGSFLGRLFD